MNDDVSLLLLEDDDLDAELVLERLRADGLPARVTRARTRAEFEAALAVPHDVVLSDFSLPGYDGLAALDEARRRAPETPFLFVSGAIGEERAIETLRRGATDYVLKDRLERLAPAVARALDAAAERRLRQEAEAERDRLLVSERLARAHAESSNRMKDEFLAVVSHELRTPLGAILGWASLLLDDDRDETTRRRALRTIERNARVQARLIEDLLDISRIITGKLQLRLQPVELESVVSAAVDAVRPAAEAKAITLAVDAAGAGTLRGDADRLQQVVWNLLSNAVKFTPRGGQVALTVRRGEGSVTIEVADSGLGIEPSFLPHVFDRFRQADGTATRRHGGLGLGLAIVRHLVEGHGGTVAAHSEGAGRGARFVVVVPAGGAAEPADASDPALPTPRAPASSDPGEPPASLRSVRVLVVDDEADARDLVAFVLRSHGAEVVVASSVAEALALLGEARPSVIVSDIGMPDVDGYTFVRRLRALPDEAGGNVPAVALTAYARELDRREAERAGYQRHLAKPVVPARLVAVVAELAGFGSAQVSAEA